jgi:hypothetical protein
MKRKLPPFLRFVDKDERGPGYIVRNAGRGITPYDLYKLERQMRCTPMGLFADIREYVGEKGAFEFLVSLIPSGVVRERPPLSGRSGRPVYMVRCYATIADVLENLERASIETSAEMLGRKAPMLKGKLLSSSGLTQQDLPAPQEAPMWMLIYMPRDLYEAIRAKEIHQLRLDTVPNYKDKKARDEL